MSLLPTITILIQIVYIGFFGWAAFAKLTKHKHMVAEFENFQLPYWLAQFSAIVESVVVVCLIAGFFNPMFSFFGYQLLVPTMIGAALINFWKRPIQYGIGVVVLLLVPAALLTHYTFMTHIAPLM